MKDHKDSEEKTEQYAKFEALLKKVISTPQKRKEPLPAKA